MKIIGLTGSIGMGKSVVAAMLRQRGIPVFDSDKTVHEYLAPNGRAIKAIVALFPSVWNRKSNSIDRLKLGAIVFHDPTAREKLENIIHPMVREGQKEFILKARRMGQKAVALDIPLLFETGAESRCDKVICVTAPAFIQRQRVLKRPNMTPERFAAIVAQQWPDKEKRRMADAVLHTGLGRATTMRHLHHIILKLLKDKTHA